MHIEQKEQPKSRISNKKIWRRLDYFFAFGFGLGKIKVMPGTFGTLGAIPIYLLIHDLNPVWYITICLILFGYGIYICGIAEDNSGIKDNPSIVWDEIVGFLFALFAVPFSVSWIALSFIIFRVFDIFKPWPIKVIEKKMSGGLAIMLDDLMAALYSWLIVQILLHFVH